MSLKDSHRHPTEPLLEEDKDFYLSFLNKKLRNIRKKLEQIDDLLKRDQSALKREQLDKISSRPEVVKSVEHYENLKQIYYAAYKTAIEEGRAPNQERSMDRTQAKDQQAATSTQANSAPQSAESTSVVNTGTSDDLLRDALRKVVNLVSLSQVVSRSGLAGALEKEQNPVTSEDIKSLEQFYQSVLVFGESQAGVKIEDRVNQAVDKLVSYVKGEDQSAVEARTYKSLQETVERAVNTPSFRDIRPAHDSQPTSSPQKVVENKSTSDSNQKEETRTLQSSFQESSEQDIQAAPVLQPDFDDSSRSPVQHVAPREPKMVKFVDEIEKDLLAHPRDDTKPVSQERRTSILKEPKHTGDHSATEKPQENGEEEVQEQRSFKRKRFSNETGYSNNAGKGKYGGKQYNKGGNSWQKKNGDYEDDGYGNDKTYKKDKYESNDYYKPRGRNNQYQYTEYVEKKSL